MVMSEYEMIHRMINRIFSSKLIQRFIGTPERIFPVMSEPVALRPIIAEAEGHPRMEHAEEDLQKTAMEY